MFLGQKILSEYNLWKVELLFGSSSGNTNSPIWFSQKFELVLNVAYPMTLMGEWWKEEGNRVLESLFLIGGVSCFSLPELGRYWLTLAHTGACLLVFWNLLRPSLGITHALMLADTFPSICPLTTPSVASTHSAYSSCWGPLSPPVALEDLFYSLDRAQLACVKHPHFLWFDKLRA